MKILKVLTLLLTLSLVAFAQAPTNSPQFQVNMNFLGGRPYGQAAALSTAVTSQFTTNTALRFDVMAMPGAGYTGYVGGLQGNLCGISALETLLSTTSLSCGKFSPYLNGQMGLGRIQSGGTSANGLAGLVRIGANYDPTGSGTFTLNLFEAGWGHFGPSLVGQPNNGFFYQTGISIGLGSNASATAAKLARMKRAEAKKMKKLQEQAAKAAK